MQIFKFALAGAFCAGIEFISFFILIDFFKLEYLVANVISIIIAVTINYVLSRAFVFQKSRYSKTNEMLSFFFFSLLALLLNQFILWFLVDIIKLDVRLCKAIAIAMVAFFSYVTKKHIVFKA
ncbi:GtrA family protein [Pedobacter gandavensis]|uniref:GtrA family protein n=1 Tax=Pedobacter gandavensis TaxID=2679963 RepID=UPI00292FA990|nr:GtrA family protein [Pedobacter gandavensis]